MGECDEMNIILPSDYHQLEEQNRKLPRNCCQIDGSFFDASTRNVKPGLQPSSPFFMLRG